jgi:hypothetical protein
MNEIQLLTQMIARLDTNQMALQAAIEEVALWIRERGSEDVAGNVSGALGILIKNADFIAEGIAQLTVSTSVNGWRGP